MIYSFFYTMYIHILISEFTKEVYLLGRLQPNIFIFLKCFLNLRTDLCGWKHWAINSKRRSDDKYTMATTEQG